MEDWWDPIPRGLLVYIREELGLTVSIFTYSAICTFLIRTRTAPRVDNQIWCFRDHLRFEPRRY